MEHVSMILERNARLFVINSLQLTSFGIYRSRRSSRDRERERGEGRLSWWRGQERVTCPRHLQFFFPCLAPARCPRSQSVTTDRPVPRNGAKISLKLIERGCYDFLGTGGAHTIAVSWINYRLTYVRTAIFFFFSAPVKYSSPKDSKRIIPFFLFTDNFVRKHRKEISKFED